jgi:branched-chain amino acid transport system permease protein
MNANTPMTRTIRHWWPPFILAAGLLVPVVALDLIGDSLLNQTLTEALIRVIVVVGLYIFVGNSGIISFGHIAFMMIGAYAAAWQTCCPMTREIFMPGLPEYMLTHSNSFVPAIVIGGLVSATVALIAGAALMRLSGIAASIGTFAFLMICYSFYLRWSAWTGGASSIVGIPYDTTPWSAYAVTVVTIIGAFLYSRSRFGLALRSSREDEVASKAAGTNVVFQRLVAFVISAFFVGMAGGLYGHFLGMITVDTFYLSLTFITLSMLVIGGMQSLSGAVVGVVVISVLIEVLRQFESGFGAGDDALKLPSNSAEVGLGVVMLLILIFRPKGLTGNMEIYWPWKGNPTAETTAKRQS